MKLHIITCPYDSGLRGVRMGAGPEHLLEAGLPDRLTSFGHSVEMTRIEVDRTHAGEIRTAFEVMRGVALAVKGCVREGCPVVVLSGNCNAAIGTVAGLGQGNGILWFDAHGEFNTPETTTSGFLDGMGLAMMVGRCWQRLVESVPGFCAVPESDIALAGAHDLDPLERAALHGSDVTVLAPHALRGGAALGKALDMMAGRVRGLYVHLDPDVIDPTYGRANTFAAPGGISPAELLARISEVGRRLPILAIGVASYDPVVDATGAIREVALACVEAVAAPPAGGAR